MKRIKRLFDYTTLLIKYEVLKHEDKRHLKKIDKLDMENQTLRMCLLSEEKRTDTFRRSYHNKINECEDLLNVNRNQSEEIKKLERKVQKNDRANWRTIKRMD